MKTPKVFHAACFIFTLAALDACFHFLAAQSSFEVMSKPGLSARQGLTLKTTSVTTDYPENCMDFIWNEGQSVWDTTASLTYSYTQNGGLVERIVSSYVGNTFTLSYRDTVIYGAQGYDSIAMTENWDGSAWVPSFRFLHAYDSVGNLILSIGNIWNGSSWDTSSGYRATYTYRNTDQIATNTQEAYTLGGGWHFTNRFEYVFDNQDQWDTITSFVYSQSAWQPDKRLLDIGWHDFSKNQPDSGRFQSFNGGWYDYERYHTTYAQYDSEVWIYEKFGTQWTLAKKYLFNFDYRGNEVLYESYEWVGAWMPTYGAITHFTYGPSGERLEVWDEWFDGYIYRRNSRQVYNSFFTQTGPITSHAISATVFPNPMIGAHDRLHLQIELPSASPVVLSLYDLQGHLRAQSVANIGATATIVLPLPSQLESGAYLYRVSSRSGETQGRILIQR